mmetsp:Transcript_4513/g.11635  ORF Transcript_4513/g.11635 Transcript_4513/m.11635 type:complete len:281 (+) Transcript_4513:1959-2801(+)
MRNVDGDFHEDVEAGNHRVLDGDEAGMPVVDQEVAPQRLRSQIIDAASTIRDISEDRDPQEDPVGVALAGDVLVRGGHQPLQDVREDGGVQQQSLGHLQCDVDADAVLAAVVVVVVVAGLRMLPRSARRGGGVLFLQDLVDPLQRFDDLERVGLRKARIAHDLLQQNRIDDLGVFLAPLFPVLLLLADDPPDLSLGFGRRAGRRSRLRGGANVPSSGGDDDRRPRSAFAVAGFVVVVGRRLLRDGGGIDHRCRAVRSGLEGTSVVEEMEKTRRFALLPLF